MDKLYVGMKLTRPGNEFGSYYVIRTITPSGRVYFEKYRKVTNEFVGEYDWNISYVRSTMIPYNIINKRAVLA